MTDYSAFAVPREAHVNPGGGVARLSIPHGA